MDQEKTFRYTYNAKENQEIRNIRKKYLTQEETKLEELKRLDHQVQSSGVMEALCVGVGGCLIFGLGLCFVMEVLSGARWFGILLGLIGTVGMLFAYPVYRKVLAAAKSKYVPRILQLTAELTGENM